MSEGSRQAVLGAIRAALGRGRLDAGDADALDRRLAAPAANVVPARGQRDGEALVQLFVAEAERVNAAVARVPGWPSVPAVVAGYLRDANLPLALKLAPDPLVGEVPWGDAPLLAVQTGGAAADDTTAVVAAFAGIAETGTVMLVSGPDNPTNLNFLPEVHVVLLPAAWVVGTYEDAFALLRAARGPGEWPRTVNWITGPSRTADIEQTLLLGAHGPKRLLIVLVDGDPQPAAGR
jgi:L-lactate dehydrogenase complex protein LldG